VLREGRGSQFEGGEGRQGPSGSIRACTGRRHKARKRPAPATGRLRFRVDRPLSPASASASIAALMHAHRVPPSACSTCDEWWWWKSLKHGRTWAVCVLQPQHLTNDQCQSTRPAFKSPPLPPLAPLPTPHPIHTPGAPTRHTHTCTYTSIWLRAYSSSWIVCSRALRMTNESSVERRSLLPRRRRSPFGVGVGLVLGWVWCRGGFGVGVCGGCSACAWSVLSCVN